MGFLCTRQMGVWFTWVVNQQALFVWAHTGPVYVDVCVHQCLREYAELQKWGIALTDAAGLSASQSWIFYQIDSLTMSRPHSFRYTQTHKGTPTDAHTIHAGTCTHTCKHTAFWVCSACFWLRCLQDKREACSWVSTVKSDLLHRPLLCYV